jgi:hypothetical protein
VQCRFAVSSNTQEIGRLVLKTPEDLVYTPNVPRRRGAWGTGELETAGGEGLSTGSKDSFQVKAPNQSVSLRSSKARQLVK